MLKVEDRFMIKELHHKGVSISDIARLTGHDRKTVRAAIQAPLLRQRRPAPPRRRIGAPLGGGPAMRAYFLLGLAIFLTGCASDGGFSTGGLPSRMPPELYNVYIETYETDSPLYQALRQDLMAQGVRVADMRSETKTILRISREGIERRTGRSFSATSVDIAIHGSRMSAIVPVSSSFARCRITPFISAWTCTWNAR